MQHVQPPHLWCNFMFKTFVLQVLLMTDFCGKMAAMIVFARKTLSTCITICINMILTALIDTTSHDV